MLRLLREIPTYAYIAGLVGAAATYVLYTPSSSGKKRRKNLNESAFPRGLINYKNECFINVILQSLASSNKVTEWLVHNRIKSISIHTNLFDTLCQAIAGINKIRMANTASELDQFHSEFYAAQSIKQALNAHNWHIQSEEHDCHEFFHLLMDVLDEEQLESNKSFKSLNYFQPSNLKESARLSSKKNPFHGYLALQFHCLDCDYKYPLKLESFYSLSLNIPHHTDNLFGNNFTLSGTTLFECLNNFFKTEILLEMKCENCAKQELKHEKKKGILKRQAIAKLPDCLCIQIQRNSWSDLSCEMIKKTTFVQFPMAIRIDNNSKANMSSFCLKQVGIGGLVGGKAHLSPSVEHLTHKKIVSNVDNFYELRSAVVHYGNALSGHFVVFRRLLENEANGENWLQISDNDIKLVKQTNLLNSNVYMLFYDKISQQLN
ncbi:ubiquitin carboxyl-terminal hydrolase 30 isoform X2 [Brachionus plicatilis]|uniref:ubiquitinyl hydrolase 1 n=1 Tax=Brachionus plicatilis TaxID=10195 RepID=A0A3M7SLW4_BRAPC|nr:ubiquitin carboxyl-terminal hydrolase 30 isoform X2 [Brachionus plicatilis]